MNKPSEDGSLINVELGVGMLSWEPHRKILEELVQMLKEIRDPSDRKILLSTTLDMIPKVRWWGLSVILDRLLRDLLREKEDAMVYAFGIIFLSPRYPDRARDLAKELLMKINELSKWDYDRAIALIHACRGALNLNDFELAKTLIQAALRWARNIPDRSDRSDAFSRIVPLLYSMGYRDRAIKLIDEIVYEPKKIDAVLSIIKQDPANESVINILRNKISPEEIPILMAARAKALPIEYSDKIIEICDNTVAMLPGTDGIKEVSVLITCFSALIRLKRDGLERALKIYNDLKNSLLTRLSERTYLDLFLELLEIFVENGYGGKIRGTLDKLLAGVDAREPPDNVFILNRIAPLYAKMGVFSEAARILEKAYTTAINLPRLVSTPALIDACASTMAVLNTFPDDFPEEIVLEFADRIRPAEKALINIYISMENLDFLKKKLRVKNINEAIDNLILKERILEDLKLEDKARAIILSLVERGEGIILHYLLKFIYEIGMPEVERVAILRLLGRAVEMLTNGKTSGAKEYVELIFARLRRQNITLATPILDFLREYVLATLM